MSCSSLIRSCAHFKSVGIGSVITGLLMLTGCDVMSIHPLYEDVLSPKDPDIVIDNGLTGSWTLTERKMHYYSDHRRQG